MKKFQLGPRANHNRDDIPRQGYVHLPAKCSDSHARFSHKGEELSRISIVARYGAENFPSFHPRAARALTHTVADERHRKGEMCGGAWQVSFRLEYQKQFEPRANLRSEEGR